ncbi:DUF3892 domain-containing protein [Hydrogenophaga sp. BPS33]|uniref:DUF3892 domain-containing protein n=1 Tax=Hydrogenophaga sp. BPS33 TaxID=2651974 RepID=UPI00131FF6C6|nr:DUF3892 domain-containing protein [Hydrogenophaga sp. BPS33]QHE83447.1 DUF3892 domain-containing protein [Hydrogenophaga sp. BPS33]
MHEYEVNCVTKPHRDSPHEAITHIGNTFSRWRMTTETAIASIESKSAAFYTVDKSRRVRAYIGVVREPGRAPYLRTYADQKWNNNLLAQGDCGAECKLV